MFQLKLYLLYIKVIMVSGELTIVVSACLLRSEEQQGIMHAVLHAQVGQQHLQTKPVKSQIKKQFAWQEKLIFKVTNERVIRFWLSDELRKGEEKMVGECTINLSVINNEKFPLFLFWKNKQTAVIDLQMSLDRKGSKYVEPQKRMKKLTLKFIIRSAVLTKDMELLGSMRPTVKITIGPTTHQTYDGKGKNPIWDQEIIFQGVKPSDEIFFTVLDKELLGKDDIIGTIFTTVQSLKSERAYDLQIKSRGDVVGSLKFDLKQYYQ